MDNHSHTMIIDKLPARKVAISFPLLELHHLPEEKPPKSPGMLSAGSAKSARNKNRSTARERFLRHLRDLRETKTCQKPGEKSGVFCIGEDTKKKRFSQ